MKQNLESAGQGAKVKFIGLAVAASKYDHHK